MSGVQIPLWPPPFPLFLLERQLSSDTPLLKGHLLSRIMRVNLTIVVENKDTFMDFLASFFSSLIPFVVVLSVIVYVHEMGHYVVARWNGVRVDVFSIGFGPEIFGWYNKHGTRWKVSYIPLGGYVKLASEDEVEGTEESRTDPGSMMNKTPWQRIAITIAGPAANYLLAIALFTGLYVSVGQKIPLNQILLGDVVAESAAEKSGLKAGDIITAVDGVAVLNLENFLAAIVAHPNTPLQMHVKRGDDARVLSVTPAANELPSGKLVGKLGVGLGPVVDYKVHGFLGAIYHAAKDSWDMTVQTLRGLGQMILGERSADGLSGPIGIATVAGQVAQQGVVALIWLAALLSINLGLINLFPVPTLDGGHILFYLIEGIRGKPVKEKAQEYAYRVGFLVLIALTLFSTWNDLSRLRVIQWIQGLFS